MNGAITGAAVAAALTLTGISADASCADPRSAAQAGTYRAVAPIEMQQRLGAFDGSDHEGARRIVGTWHVSVSVEGNPFADAFIHGHGDRSEWENLNLPLLGGNICLGEWTAIDHSHVARQHTGWLYTNGTLTGYFTETDTISPNGNAYQGTNDQKICDLNGKLQVEVTGTSLATRLFR